MSREDLTLLISLAGLVVVFIAAVVGAVAGARHTHLAQEKLLQHQRRLKILRGLVGYRIDREDPKFASAINLVDIEFSDFKAKRWDRNAPKEKEKAEAVRKALENFLAVSNNLGSAEAKKKAAALVLAVSNAIGITVSEVSFFDGLYDNLKPRKSQQGTGAGSGGVGGARTQPSISQLTTSPSTNGGRSSADEARDRPAPNPMTNNQDPSGGTNTVSPDARG